MKVVILAGGLGLRMKARAGQPPKPLVRVADRPIIEHVMDIFAAQGFDDFVVCAGHRGEEIAHYFDTHTRHRADVVATGETTMTGGRIKRVAPLLEHAPFFVTYADGVADIDLGALLAYHRQAGALVTLTAVHPPARFGLVELAEDGVHVQRFAEKGDTSQYVNGGFMVVEPAALELVEGDATEWERSTLTFLAARGWLAAHRHEGFWRCVDTPQDRLELEQLCASAGPPWLAASSRSSECVSS